MARKPQKRTLETRARLITAAEALISEKGYEALRVEEVVAKAGVAKGTFFAHFRDKDTLLDQLIGARIDRYLDDLESLPVPQSADIMADALTPLLEFMTCERYVFDLILRYSGALAIEEIGPIAMTFDRIMVITAQWVSNGPYRDDVPSDMLAEGIQAFSVQAMALKFCVVHSNVAMKSRFIEYLNAWLLPRK